MVKNNDFNGGTQLFLAKDSWTSLSFPKETKNAVLMQLEKIRKQEKQQRNIEVQTSPKISTTRIYPAFKIPKNLKKIPCPKNLLCEKGLHNGRCGRKVLQRQKVSFREGKCEINHFQKFDVKLGFLKKQLV